MWIHRKHFEFKINIDSYRLSNQEIVCRGPDKTSELFSNSSKIFKLNNSNLNILAIFNRLSILELTELGDQPIYSIDNKTMLLFNGEIYNHNNLRKNLESKGIKFKSKNSDSEVLFEGLSFTGSVYKQISWTICHNFLRFRKEFVVSY